MAAELCICSQRHLFHLFMAFVCYIYNALLDVLFKLVYTRDFYLFAIHIESQQVTTARRNRLRGQSQS